MSSMSRERAEPKYRTYRRSIPYMLFFIPGAIVCLALAGCGGSTSCAAPTQTTSFKSDTLMTRPTAQLGMPLNTAGLFANQTAPARSADADVVAWVI
jgi:hypothetical protein